VEQAGAQPSCEIVSVNGNAAPFALTSNVWTTVDIAIQYSNANQLQLYFSRTGGTGTFVSVDYIQNTVESNNPDTYTFSRATINVLLWGTYTTGPGTYYLLPFCYTSQGGFTLGTTKNIAITNGEANYLDVAFPTRVFMEFDAQSFYVTWSINYRILGSLGAFSYIERYLRTPSGTYQHLPSYADIQRASIKGASPSYYQVLYGVDGIYSNGNYSFDFVVRDNNANVLLNTSESIQVVLKSVDSITTIDKCKYKKDEGCWVQWGSTSLHTDNTVNIYLVPEGFVTPKFVNEYTAIKLTFSSDGGK